MSAEGGMGCSSGSHRRPRIEAPRNRRKRSYADHFSGIRLSIDKVI